MNIKIEPYSPKYRDVFFKLNEEWITSYFQMEKPDRDALENPQEYILDKGGFIFVATIDDEPVGVCALIKRDDLNCYELAKMAVSPKAQGKGIGFLLGQAAIDKATALKAERIFLESNTVLEPAIRLYEKLGFQRTDGFPSPYERGNIQMELVLETPTQVGEIEDPEYRQRVHESFERQGFMRHLGAQVIRLEPGLCEIRVPYAESLTQQHGFFHAGVTGAIADSASGYAAFTLMPKNSSVLTVEYKLNLVAPAKGETLVAEARVVRAGKTLTVCQCEVRAVTENQSVICAVSQSTIFALRGKPDRGE